HRRPDPDRARLTAGPPRKVKESQPHSVREGGDGSLSVYDSAKRARAAWLGTLLGQEAVPALIDALRDDDPVVRFAVVKALGEIGTETAAAPLADLLRREEDGDIVKETIAALGKIGSKAAVPALIEALQKLRPSPTGWGDSGWGSVRSPGWAEQIYDAL